MTTLELITPHTFKDWLGYILAIAFAIAAFWTLFGRRIYEEVKKTARKRKEWDERHFQAVRRNYAKQHEADGRSF